MAIRDAMQALGIEVRAGLHTGRVRACLQGEPDVRDAVEEQRFSIVADTGHLSSPTSTRWQA